MCVTLTGYDNILCIALGYKRICSLENPLHFAAFYLFMQLFPLHSLAKKYLKIVVLFEI